MTGPISFSDSAARRHLLRYRYVYTLRPRDRTTGETWLRFERTGPKRGEVQVERWVGEPTREDIEELADESGLETAERWLDAAQRLHRTEDPLEGLSVYLVKLRSYTPEPLDEEPVEEVETDD